MIGIANSKPKGFGVLGITIRIGAAYDRIEAFGYMQDRALLGRAMREGNKDTASVAKGELTRVHQAIVGLYQKEPTFAPKKPKGKKARKAAIAKS